MCLTLMVLSLYLPRLPASLPVSKKQWKKNIPG